MVARSKTALGSNYQYYSYPRCIARTWLFSINENPHFEDYFHGDLIYTAGYFHDAIPGTVTDYRVLTPDGISFGPNDNNKRYLLQRELVVLVGPRLLTAQQVNDIRSNCEGDVLTHPFIVVFYGVEEEKKK